MLIRGAVTEYTYRRSSTGGNASFLKGVGIAASTAEAMVGLDIRIYSVATGQIIDSVRAEGKAKSSAAAIDIQKEDWSMSASSFKQSPLGHATRQAIEKAVGFICKRMGEIPWEGRIADIEGGDGSPITGIYINAGSDMGLKTGDELDILRPGKDIIDPETRVVIGRKKDLMLGRCRIDSMTKALSIAVPVSGEDFQVGDTVSLVGTPRPIEPYAAPTESPNGSTTDGGQTQPTSD